MMFVERWSINLLNYVTSLMDDPVDQKGLEKMTLFIGFTIGCLQISSFIDPDIHRSGYSESGYSESGYSESGASADDDSSEVRNHLLLIRTDSRFGRFVNCNPIPSISLLIVTLSVFILLSNLFTQS